MTSRPSMPITIPATTAHRQFGNLIKRVFSGGEHFIVEKDGLPVIVILSMAEYEELMQERQRQEQDKQERLKKFRKAARVIGEAVERTGLTEEEVIAKLEEAKEEVYQEYYGSKSTK